ncbi:hypothetical protein ACVNP1_08985 [Staphylococcus aureus]
MYISQYKCIINISIFKGDVLWLENLQRELSNRHIQLIAIGGAIGTGLFLGAGQTIALTGLSILLT